MKLYFAPLEGITTYIYRNAHAKMFGGCDAYYSPFITPSDNEKIGRKGFRDILPENNSAPLKIQVLTNNSQSFLKFADKAKSYGYNEINLNLGCPSGTVVGKNRGAGFLRNTDMLDKFLYEIFCASSVNISIKTRVGYFSADEFDSLMEIYNKYPLSLLIIHPRCREDFYKGEPHIASFEKAYENSPHKLCYNGNVFSVSDFESISSRFPDIDSIMIGRGAVANPAIFREIAGGKRLTTAELIEFTQILRESYGAVLDSDTFTLHKLKEIWIYMMQNFPNEKKILKTVKRTNKLSEFMEAIYSLPQMQTP